MISAASSNRESCFVCVIRRGVRDQAPNTMDMDTQPQGQQAAVPVFQPQVTPHRCTLQHQSEGLRIWSRMQTKIKMELLSLGILWSAPVLAFI